MSPRKSSTSSGRPKKDRPRYLGVEVAGEPFPHPSPPAWNALLKAGLDRVPGERFPRFRLLRAEGRRAIVEVAHTDLAAARIAWNAPVAGSPQLRLSTRRTWGTLVGAKRWIRERNEAGGERAGRPD